jgi:hypothetical protein
VVQTFSFLDAQGEIARKVLAAARRLFHQEVAEIVPRSVWRALAPEDVFMARYDWNGSLVRIK